MIEKPLYVGLFKNRSRITTRQDLPSMRRSADTQSRFPSKDFPGTLPRHAADLQISNTRILLETDQEELVMPRSRIGDEDGSDGSGNEGTPETQAKVDGAVGKLALYYYATRCARVWAR